MTVHRGGWASGAQHLPQPVPEPPPLPAPQDRPYPGLLRLAVDATDVQRCIFRMRQTIPVAGPGRLTLLYPKWLPGFHSPAACIELLAGLEFFAGGERLAWRRDPVEMHAFHLDAPTGAEAIEAAFQFLSPTAASQGSIEMTAAMMWVHWGALALYPAGFFSRGITVQASLTLPEGWSHACALEAAETHGPTTTFVPAPLDELVDSPVLAGRWFKRIDLDDGGRVRLSLAGERPDLLEATDDQIAPHRRLVAEADALFASRHFERYDFLAAVSDELGGGGVEHHRSCEIVAPAAYFKEWDANAPRRDIFAHEYTHAWNGKFRRGSDSWTPSFERPIRNSLMWIYEGLTQYWGEVLAARSGLWSAQQARDTLARTAALYDNRPGGRWRPMSDTTRDPIISGRQALPWPSWQRSEDYYAEGQLLWLDADTLIRELSGDTRSLDDFARAFFGVADGETVTCTYDFEDVVAALDALAPHDWTAFFQQRLEERTVGAPLDGLTRGGYRLVYRKTPSDFTLATDNANGTTNLRFSIGVAAGSDGTLQEVIWESPAFEAGLVAGARLLAVNGEVFAGQTLKQAVADAERTGQIALTIQRGKRYREAVVRYAGGLRYPHLERIDGARPRLDEILAPRG